MQLPPPVAPLRRMLRLAGLLLSGLVPIQVVGAGAGTPAPVDLIQGVKSARMQIPTSRLEMRVTYKSATQTGEWELTCEFDADKCRVIQTKPKPEIRTLFDGTQVIQFDSNQRVVLRSIADGSGDFLFDPRLLGIAIIDSWGATIADALPHQRATQLETIRRSQVGDRDAWHVRLINTNEYDLTIDAWIDEKNDFRVYRYEYSISGNKPSVVSHKRLELFFFCFAHSWAGATWLDLLKSLPTPMQFLHDGIHGRGPDKRFWIGIPRGQKLINRLLEIGHTDKDPSPNPFPGQFAKPAFDQIQPT